MSIKIGFNKYLGLGCLAVSIWTLAVAIYTGSPLLGALGSLHLPVSVLLLWQTYLVVTDDELTVHNLFGQPRKRVPIDGLGDLRVVRGQLHFQADQELAPIPGFRRSIADRTHWNDLHAAIRIHTTVSRSPA
ncbi:MAG: hypothetical protein CMH54_02805 [Myxococcales bacterium]|nr:hypothetical protein [Myxococcales bacterium]